jgi:hypothetical protein
LLNQSSLKDKSKLTPYTSVRVNFGREKFLDAITNVNLRRTITKIRLSDHHLDIETGRRLNIAKHPRFCSLCNTGEIGDEFHVLMKCTNFEAEILRKRA